jgi:hypothetical protein
MSSEALAWAFKANVKPSSVKFTLVALCECANYRTGKIFPSIEHICQITGQDRKTVISNIGKLASDGWITETGERVGKTGQIKVYVANIGTVPNVEQSQERNSSESPSKESQKRDTEPSKEPSRYINNMISANWLPLDAWNGWIEMRHKMKKPLTDRAKERALKKLEKMYNEDQDITEVLDRSTMNGWTDLYEIKEKTNGKANRTANSNGSPRDGFAAVLREVGSREDAFPTFDDDGGMRQASPTRLIAPR